MAAASLLALLDDIATLLDDVSAMTQVAAKKTAAVMGDDLAVNAEKVIGVRPSRELPVVWAVARGSLVNKAILVPAAVAIAYLAPWLITPMLVCGGLFLCFEGAEKVLHSVAAHSEEQAAERLQQLDKSPADLVAMEKKKIRGAVRTDFILSLEIIVLTLAVVEESDWITQFGVLSGISLLMVAFVYGLVAAIVKVDDVGFYLMNTKESPALKGLGRGLVAFAPKLMHTLSILGTIAMFLVGGGILLHAFHVLEVWLVEPALASGVPAVIATNGIGGLVGLLAGVLLVSVIGSAQTLLARLRG
jgi:predicted DNA repair protein MutK